MVRDSCGFTLIELLVAAVVFILVGAGVSALYLSTKRAFDVGSAQAFVQRQGTAIQEEIARQLRPAVAMLQASSAGNTCGGVAAPLAIAFQITPDAANRDPLSPQSPYRCLYQLQDTGDTFPQLYICNLSDPRPGSSTLGDVIGAHCAVGTKRNLLLQSLHPTAGTLGVEMAAGTSPARARLRVSNTNLCANSTPSGASCTPNPGVAHYTVVSFDLTDGSLFSLGLSGVNGIRFGFTVTTRN